jgi:hypothetical protein
MIYVARKKAGVDEWVLMETRENEAGKMEHHEIRPVKSNEEGIIRVFVEYYKDDPEEFRRAVVEFVTKRGTEDPMSKRAMKLLKEME